MIFNLWVDSGYSGCEFVVLFIMGLCRWWLWVCGLVLAGSSNLWVAMVVIGLAVAGVGYWFAGFMGLFMVVLPSKKERDGRKEKE